MINVLFMAPQKSWAAYKTELPAAIAEVGVTAHVSPDIPDEEVDYIVYGPKDTGTDFTAYPRLKAVLGLWAGVESIVGNETLTVPLARMVDPGLANGMVEWVTGHVLRHHLGMDAHIVNPDHLWAPSPPPLARNRRVTILGLGELGTACGTALARLGFDVTGWSRTPRSVPDLRCLAGPSELETAIDGAEILVLLLPLTPETENTLDAPRLARLSPGAVVLNPGRGALVDDTALLAALESGQVGHATLDTFRTEPLPADHPYWQNDQVTVTPHIASATRPDTASVVIAENLRRAIDGAPLLHLVDRSRGY
ncbi:2-hydroxyacid dehydrogenase [Roseisalinus antarcticus]|uniref:Glyoxylate/hydroxypyruvate reductase A n=1 Tax=Roseisalinus antarcticus TaxID=254357 RepID=A0A1Y5TYC8_9RHOB|nr:glyoxylate/hydroxypyruvate reductase A [Roseisalinus antarcticus]SLN75739.1 Glyoxylate/hydroxypyruvate reductase A [Roseisalinus antarcticus]